VDSTSIIANGACNFERSLDFATAGVDSTRASILACIGNTPMVGLDRVFSGEHFRLCAKLEGTNPGGSAKDRAALSMLSSALRSGEIYPDTTIIESSSGNMGIGLAQACCYFRLPFICVVDMKTTAQNVSILRAYGAKIDMISTPDPVTGEFLQARLNRVRALRESIPNSWWVNQYSNGYAAAAYHSMMDEIVRQLGGAPDYLFCATGTCGTLRGCADYIRNHALKTKIWAVDAVGSVIFGDKRQKRLLPGHGSACVPALFMPGLAERCIHVTDKDCILGCRKLLREEAILVGGSSGAIIAAIEQVREEIERGAVCVAILADRGERYLDTVYSDDWVRENFGNVVVELAQQTPRPCISSL
jgi:2,3-diaminopropionate biosynthesis protein SbnA